MEFIDILEKIEKQGKLKKYDPLDKSTYPSDPEQRKILLSEPQIETATEILALMIKRLTRTIPPKSGPTPQGLNIQHNTVKTVGLEKLNGRRQYRQSFTQRRANNRIT